MVAAGSHMNPLLNSCINVGLSGRWAHDAHVWFFRTCRMRLDDAVGDLLTSWGRIQVCFGQILSKSWSWPGAPGRFHRSILIFRFHNAWAWYFPGLHCSWFTLFTQRYIQNATSFHQLNIALTDLRTSELMVNKIQEFSRLHDVLKSVFKNSPVNDVRLCVPLIRFRRF